MLAKLKSIIKSSRLFAELRKIKYRQARQRSKNKTVLSLSSMQRILVEELNIQQGDNIIVHCGFGFLRADFSPLQLVGLLKELVGTEGSIVMPFYPPGLSSDWANAGRDFNIDTVKCSTGVLAQTFASSDVLTSIHPIKSVCAWGKNAEQLISEHQHSQYPFDDKSPYYKISLLNNSKTVGLGVSNCSMIHCAEDLYEKDKSYLYSNDPVKLKVTGDNVGAVVNTYYHHSKNKLITSETFFNLHCKGLAESTHVNDVFFYTLNNTSMLKHCSALFIEGTNRKCL